MNPEHFRRHLRKIIANTAKASAIAGTALMVGCSVTIIQGPNDGTVPDGGREITADATPGDHNKTPQSCPVNWSSRDNCTAGLFKGIYHRVLTSSDPSPLSRSECLRLCGQELTKLCSENNGPELSVGIKTTGCLEKEEGGERSMKCWYELRPQCAVAGRRPAGLEEEEPQTAAPIAQTPETEAGAFFAELAYLEHAAVTAFEYLVKELKAYDAPAPLLALATNAIQEEKEHVELMTALAKRFGATPRLSQSAPFKLRPIAEIAIENAREGCVRESFGSLLGFWQAQHSEDPAVRAVMERIAYEESNHGALSWAIDEWLRPQLDAKDLDQYHAAHEQAIAEIKTEIQEEPSEAMRRYAGFPTAAQSQHLFAQLVA